MNGENNAYHTKNLPKHELIGLEVKVVDSTDESLVGINGEVLDETQSLLRIEDKKSKKRPVYSNLDYLTARRSKLTVS